MASTIKDLAKAMYEIEQIKQLKARYFRLLDGKKWSDWRTCFTDDMHFYVNDESVPRARSGDEFVALVSSLLADAATVHQGHMPEIELTSDQTAKGIWAMFDWVDDKKDLDKSRQGYGHYLEDYEKGTDGRWRIKNLRLTRIRVDGIARKNGPIPILNWPQGVIPLSPR